KNGSVIHCLPTGDSGYGIRGFTIDRLYADEAAFIKEEVWAAVTPMLATTGGDIVLLSTPMGKENYFYRMFHNDKFTSIHVNAEDIAKGRENPQKTNMIEFQKDEKERMTKLQYKQEYLGLFVGGIERFFSDELIKECCILEKGTPKGDKFMGIDVARKGGDETVLTSVDFVTGNIKQFELTMPEGQKLTDTARLIIHKDKSINHSKILIDDGGLGVGVYDILMEDNQTKRKTISINNASRSIERPIKNRKIGTKYRPSENRKVPLMKEALYINMKLLMEQGKLKLLNSPEVQQSLRSIQSDYSDGKFKIWGSYTHIVEALIRAIWGVKTKSLNILSTVF
ncbi:MAG: terminase family protein, partial [Nanoarchaeota archaeon]|nr:terminase family protein [Nanoarchaeota archaeon]